MSEQAPLKEHLFTLNLEHLEFNLESGKSASNSLLAEKPISKILVKNISQYPIAVRIVTTKKELYLVNPSYSTINPNETEEVKFTFISKEIPNDTSTHKFKFQALTINPEFQNLTPKAIYENYAKMNVKTFKTDEKGIKVVWNKIEGNVLNNEAFNNVNTDHSSVYQSVNNTVAQINNYSFNTIDDKIINTNYNNLEFEKLKSELQNLSFQYKSLQSANNELNMKIKSINESQKTTGGQSESSTLLKNKRINTNLNPPIEKGITTKILIIASVIMFILGFFLTK